MTRVSRGLGAALATAVLALGLSAAAPTDNFMSECQQGSSAADPGKASTSMSGKMTGAVRADAIARSQDAAGRPAEGPRGGDRRARAVPVAIGRW